MPKKVFRHDPKSRKKRYCGRCMSWKMPKDFYVWKSGRVCATCRSCVKATGDRYRKKNKAKILESERDNRKWNRLYHLKVQRKSRMKRVYGITWERYEEIFESQKGLCAICRKKPKGKERTLDVDHCHKTNKVRGLLCCNCNRGLGQFKDSLELVKSAVRYLQTHR